MSHYRQLRHPGGTYFFTVNLLERHNNALLVLGSDRLQRVVAEERQRHPFRLIAWAVLPDHPHCTAACPKAMLDFPGHWRRIKNAFSRSLPATEYRSPAQIQRRERGISQRRYWDT